MRVNNPKFDEDLGNPNDIIYLTVPEGDTGFSLSKSHFWVYIISIILLTLPVTAQNSIDNIDNMALVFIMVLFLPFIGILLFGLGLFLDKRKADFSHLYDARILLYDNSFIIIINNENEQKKHRMAYKNLSVSAYNSDKITKLAFVGNGISAKRFYNRIWALPNEYDEIDCEVLRKVIRIDITAKTSESTIREIEEKMTNAPIKTILAEEQ